MQDLLELFEQEAARRASEAFRAQVAALFFR
jgi:hypothetical protein